MTLVDQSPELDGVEESPQVLFPEANRRRKNRWITVIAVATLITLGIGVSVTAILRKTVGGGSGQTTPNILSAGQKIGIGTVNGIVNPTPPTYQGFGASLWFVSTDAKKVAVSVPADSVFAVRLPAGSYTVRTRGRMTMVPYGIASCSTKKPVHIRSGSTIHIAVDCVGHQYP
jgi:hypothetical protein